LITALSQHPESKEGEHLFSPYGYQTILESYQHSDSDWKIISKLLYDLAHIFQQQQPDKLSVWINEFVSVHVHSTSLQC
jgi:hypothetical protein